MSTKQDTLLKKKKELASLEGVINSAIKKVRGTKENDLCKYIPMETGGYMHHFTLKKMKKREPSILSTLIERFIIKADKPSVVAPKPRAPRGSRKKKDQLTFSKIQLERLLNMAILAGDKEMVNVLSPSRSLGSLKRQLIKSIREERIEEDLWRAYADTIEAHQAIKNGDFNTTAANIS